MNKFVVVIILGAFYHMCRPFLGAHEVTLGTIITNIGSLLR